MLQHLHWWIDIGACTKWWVRRRLKYQARKTTHQTVRWPVLPIPLPNSPGISVGSIQVNNPKFKDLINTGFDWYPE